MSETAVNMEELMKEIHEATKKQRSANKTDEVNVMRTMLNDADFSVAVYDRSKGYIGQRSPREESRKFIANITSSLTGIEYKNATELANEYEFSKKDASFLIENGKDFISTYLTTGRKLPLIQTEDSEAALLLRHIDSKEKQVPDGSTTVIPEFNKVVCKSKCPKYIGQKHD